MLSPSVTDGKDGNLAERFQILARNLEAIVENFL